MKIERRCKECGVLLEMRRCDWCGREARKTPVKVIGYETPSWQFAGWRLKRGAFEEDYCSLRCEVEANAAWTMKEADDDKTKDRKAGTRTQGR